MTPFSPTPANAVELQNFHIYPFSPKFRFPFGQLDFAPKNLYFLVGVSLTWPVSDI